MAGREVDWDEVQGIVLSGYRDKAFTRYFLLEIADAGLARKWLKGELDSGCVSFGDDSGGQCPSLIIAFTYAGLRAIGLPQDALNTFPWDFRDGMVSKLRQRLLGDSNLAQWDWGYPDGDILGRKEAQDAHQPPPVAKPVVHLLVILYACSPQNRDADSVALRMRWAGALSEIPTVTSRDGYQPKDQREHFGFVDGLSQPAIDTSARARKLLEREDFDGIIQPGEFILGYVNERGQLPVSPSVAVVDGSDLPVITNADPSVSGHPPNTKFPRLDFGRNGTFLVYRQLRQDVHAFAAMLEKGASDLGDNRAPRLADEAPFKRLLAAKVVGRWDDGTSLTLSPNSPPKAGSELKTVNNFGYSAEDGHGLRCPVGAHVRRGNPRDTLDDNPKIAIERNKRHRLLRRGRLYGAKTTWFPWEEGEKPQDNEERGLHFVAINASIESQFEFIQQTWMNTPFFGDLTDEVDPLIGTPDPGPDRHFTIHGAPLNRRLRWKTPLVTVRGGAYFFMPSRTALQFLSRDDLMGQLALPPA